MLLEIKTGKRTNPSGRGKAPQICVLRCDVCANIYERNYSYRKLSIHRCSKTCVYGHRISDGLGGHGAVTVIETCLSCGKEQTLRKAGNERKWGRFCSRKCYGRFRSKNSDLYAENTIAMHTPEAAVKISESIRERMSDSDYIHPMKGKTHTLSSRKKISEHHRETGCQCGEKNGMFGRKHTKNAKEKISEAISRRIIEGRMHAYGTWNKKGWYTSVKMGTRCFFRSSWEEAVMIRLDSDPNVKTWEYESIRVPYFENYHKRWYVPDFIITLQDGSREMWEVKPREFVNSERTLLKSAAGREWCRENVVNEYRVLTGDELREMKIIT